MPKIAYKQFNFRRATLDTIEQANEIIEEYEAQGFNLTLRQLYYQFVARGYIPNTDKSYNKLGSIVNDARLAGLIDWDSITDRTRNIRSINHREEPGEIIRDAAAAFRLDKWKGQLNRLEVWIEKDALVGVFEGVCQRNDVGLFSCRGYVSQSEMWAAARRLREYELDPNDDGDYPCTHILHFGDHDPSGIDMSRDIQDRLEMFGAETEVHRLALNMNQVKLYTPPPNPAKVTDSRFDGYRRIHGDESWELDALEPSVLAALVDGAIAEYRNDELYDARVEEERTHRKNLALMSNKYERIAEVLPTL